MNIHTGCHKHIVGVRYKCMHPSCPDYDLCADCEALPIAVHPPVHPLLKMRSPDTIIPTVYRVGGTTLIDSNANTAPSPPTRSPASSRSNTKPAEPLIDFAGAAAEVSPIAIPTLPIVPIEPASSIILPVVEEFKTPEDSEPTMQMRNKSPVSLPSFLEISNQNQAPPDSQILPSTSVEPTSVSMFSLFPVVPRSLSGAQELRAVFVSDNNIEDGQVFPAGAEFVKSWKMQNIGSLPWPEETRLMFVAGDRLPAFVNAPKTYAVGAVEPGATVDIFAYDMKVRVFIFPFCFMF